MNVGATKVVESPHQFLSETPTQSEGGLAPTSANNFNSVPLDNGRTVAVETPSNTVSYWPPSSSGLPLNNSKDTADVSQNEIPDSDRSLVPEPPKTLSTDENSSQKSLEDNSATDKCSEVSHSTGDEPLTTQPTRISHHNLPPIAGITSSHNYRMREIQKNSNFNDGITKFLPEKQGGEAMDGSVEKNNLNVGGNEFVESKVLSEGDKTKDSTKEPLDQTGDCEIVEIPVSPSVERPKTANADHIFSVPAAVNSVPHPRSLLSPRISTQYAHVSASNGSSFNEPLTLSVNANSNASAGSPSSSGRMASSPHYMGPSPTGSLSANPKCASPSESPRIIRSPHSNLASPSSLHRVSSNVSGDGLRMPSSPHLQVNPLSPSQRMGSLPYVPHSTSGNVSASRTNVNNSSVQNLHTEANRLRAGHESIDLERERALKETLLQNQGNQNLRTGLSNSSIHSANTSHTNPPQRILQHSDSQSCRNPFELPVSKSYSHSYHHHPQHQQIQQQQHHFSSYSNNNRHSTETMSNHEHFINMQQTAKEHEKTPGSTFYPPGFKATTPRLTNEKESERHHNAQFKHIFTSQSGVLQKGYQLESPHNIALMQRRTDVKSFRNEVPQKDYAKQMELPRNKAYEASGIMSNSAWKPENSELGNKTAYLNAQTTNKTFNKVNGSEYSNVRITDSGYVNSPKAGLPHPESFGARFGVSNGDKQSNNFNATNQTNSIGQRFPPVPQSNYDLNRQIYDSMTGSGRSVQPPSSRSLEKNAIPFTNMREAVVSNPQMNKSQNFYREPEKGKSYVQNNPMKQNEYPGPPRIPTRQDFRSESFGSPNSLVKPTYDDGHRTPNSQSTLFHSQVQSNDVRLSQSGSVPQIHHRTLPQSFSSGMTPAHHISQATSSINKSAGQSVLSTKHQQQVMVDYESKLMEAKSRGSLSQSQFPTQNSQSSMPTVITSQMKNRNLPSVSQPTRSKRESPLDLSVKTVRQSADSTAKDDGENYVQNFRTLIQNSSSQSDNRFPVSQSSNSPASIGAPKIDFTPDFSGFHVENHQSTSTLHHKTEVSILPPVESFKKFPTRSPTSVVMDGKIKTGFMSPKYVSPPTISSQKPLGTNMDPTTARFSDHFKLEPQKRPSNEPMKTHPSQPKIPKIDPWKLAFDQQIEQRLNSVRMSQQNNQYGERTVNGMDVSKSSTVGSQYTTNHQLSRHSSSNFRGANMYPQPPVQTSATPYNPSYVQQPQCQPATPQTPQDKIQHGKNLGHSPDPEQIIKQISKGVMPDHKLLQDKNVLSILRSSLEEKEAKLMQLREAARKKEKYKDVTTDLNKKPYQVFDQASKNQSHTKQSLPPFGALPLERMCAPPSFPGHRLNLPRAMDAVKIDIEPTQKYFTSAVKNEAEKSGIPSTDLSPQDDAQGPPTDLDGLAAFLAARIRTKGELKQVGPALEPINHQLKAHHRSILAPNDSNDRGHLSCHLLQPSNFQSSGSPPKLIRESRLLPPLRRRVVSHTEEETPTTSGAHLDERTSLPPRDPNGIRSSSETSVFDFRESDSEGEMPVLERQTLEGMRRDRKTFGSKQNVSTVVSDDIAELEKPDAIAELDRTQPDPFWDTAFDMFVEQLEKRPPKRSIRKKKICSRIPFIVNSESEEGEKSKDGMRSDKISWETTDEESMKTSVDTEESVSFEVKKEPEDVEKTEHIPENPGKLSASRLKVYRDELLREDKLREVKVEETEKLNKISENTEKESEKQKSKEVIVKKEVDLKKENPAPRPRGRPRLSEKGKAEDVASESEILPSEIDSIEGDDDSLSISGLESESSESEDSQESSNSDFSSGDESETETVTKKKMGIQTRLQTRSTRQRQVKGTGMRLRSKPVTPKVSQQKQKKRKKRKELHYPNKRKKPSFGDGSHFQPGWEEEFYKFKQQLRMPEKLISISRPPKRSSASLPDLDPYRNSPSLDSSDVSMTKKAVLESDDSDADFGKNKSRGQETSENTSPSLLKSRNGKKSQSSSILNMLVDKYGKGHIKKQKELKAMNERKSPRILPKATNKPELLPTPSLGIGKENVLKDKKKNKDVGKKKIEENDSVILGYFRKKTVNNFKEAFKQKVGMLPQEFTPVILKSRTRNQTKDLKKKTTLLEVFGEERPASAPPLSREEDISAEPEKVERPLVGKKKSKLVKKVHSGMVTRGRGKLTRSGRPGLRSTAVLRSNKAVQISKRHLNSGRKRNIELLRIRAMASKKFSYLVANSENTAQLPITKKRLKLRSVRRKFRSGFDYIRKKKKLKKDGDSADGSVKKLPTRPTAESVEDIQNEIKTWVINKGLGETILHRAARLGYTDIAAYCLEKMDCSPSPRDNAGYTPLHEACSRGHLEIAKLLLLYGASVSESAKGGIRPLHEAAENGFTELIRLLLAYGADPLLETYTGHTALSLVSDEEARRLIQHHLADVQGNVAPVWTFLGPSSLFDPPDNGYDPLCDPPSPHSVHSDCELEISEAMLPPLYILSGDRDVDRRWVLLRDLLAYTKAKNKDVLLKQLGSTNLREMKLQEFHEQAKSCNLLGMGDRPLTKIYKVTLIPYDEKVRQLLGVEKVVV